MVSLTTERTLEEGNNIDSAFDAVVLSLDLGHYSFLPWMIVTQSSFFLSLV
jgi:hypothetical protein